MLGSFGEPAIKQFVDETMNETMRLENAMRQVRAKRSLVILHYAPIVETIESEPLEIYPFLGSSRLAETIDRFKVTAIVHGHAHRGRYEGRTPGGQRGLQRRPPHREADRQSPTRSSKSDGSRRVYRRDAGIGRIARQVIGLGAGTLRIRDAGIVDRIGRTRSGRPDIGLLVGRRDGRHIARNVAAGDRARWSDCRD